MILDTNALSAYAENDPEVVRILSGATSYRLPAVVLGEYRFGLLNSRHRREREQWLESLERTSEVLAVDAETARVYAVLRQELKSAGTPIPVNDLWIVALVRQRGDTLLSRDAHFDHVPGLRRVGW